MNAPAPPPGAFRWIAPVMSGLSAPMAHPRPDGGDFVLALNLNESPIPPSPLAIAAGRAAMDGVNRYPPTDGGGLIVALSARTLVPPDRIGVAVGSDMLLHLLCMISLARGRSAVMPQPSFPRYALSTRIAGARAIAVPVTSAGANDVDAMLLACAPDTSVLFCCTPNGNTGGSLSPRQIGRLAAEVPDDILLVVDEAYAEFDPAADTLAALSQRRGPWAVTRTFSKAYALAGLRVGYVLCSEPRIAELLRAARPIFEMTSPALAAAQAALGDDAYLAAMLDLIGQGRDQLNEGLRALGFTPLPSVANFVTTDLRRPAAPVLRAMAAEGVLVRGLADPGWENFLRITVGLPAENARALAALGNALENAPART
jgi:histidinol-phosphate aminotransferase